jgi:hypothetical protein
MEKLVVLETKLGEYGGNLVPPFKNIDISRWK